VQVDTDTVEAQFFGPTEFSIDRRWIERIGLPHFELIDRRAGVEIASNQPRLTFVPLVRLIGRPAFSC
jgi:hypothetical protein